MKLKFILILMFILCTAKISYAGCSPDGKCLIQFNTHKAFIEFINENPYKIESVDYKFFLMPYYYVWYQK